MKNKNQVKAKSTKQQKPEAKAQQAAQGLGVVVSDKLAAGLTNSSRTKNRPAQPTTTSMSVDATSWEANAVKLTLLAGERHPGETDKAVIACNLFLLQPNRSVRGLARSLQDQQASLVPTQSCDTLCGWAKKFNWFERARLYDAGRQQELQQQRADSNKELENSLANPAVRLQMIDKLGSVLNGTLLDPGPWEEKRIQAKCPHCGVEAEFGTGVEAPTYPNLWIRETTRPRNAGEESRTLYRPNSAGIAALRAVLDDAARESGGRVPPGDGILRLIDISRFPLSYRVRMQKEDPFAVIADAVKEFIYDRDEDTHEIEGKRESQPESEQKQELKHEHEDH
jgi:hypothetical protein